MPVSKTRKLEDLRRLEKKLQNKIAWSQSDTRVMELQLRHLREKIKSLSV